MTLHINPSLACPALRVAILVCALIGFCPPAFAADIGTVGGSWPVFRGNAAHTGKSGLAGPPEEYERKWRWRVPSENAPVSASPVITEDGTVYSATEGGVAAALSTSGGSDWTYPVDGSVAATPAVSDDGSVLVVTDGGYIYLLGRNGELQWKCDTGYGTVSSPVLSGSTAYIGTNSNGLFAFTLQPDLSKAGTSKRVYWWDIKLWSFLTNGKITSSPAFAGNTVFFGGGTYVYALNPLAGGADNSTAKVKWKYDIHSDIHSSPAVYNGVVYIGADDGYLYALKENTDNTTIQLVWKRKTGDRIRSSPAVDTPQAGETDKETVVYVGSDDGKLYSIGERGDLKWTFATSGPIRSSPAVDVNGDIYFGSDDGSVYALYPDGSLKWKYQTGGKVRSSPAIGPDKKLYVGSDDGYLYCIGESSEEGREYDITIDVTLSLASIENNGNPTTIAAKLSSKTEGKNVLSRIASVTIDLSRLNLIGILSSGDPLEGDIEIGAIGIENMVDDGLFEDDVAGDGLFTYAFGVTDDASLIGWDEGIYTHYPALGPLGVGPVPLMVTVTDLYGNRTSKPFILKIDQKMRGVPPFEDSITSLLNNQSLNISFTSGTPSILSIIPAKGAPGQRLNVAVLGKNTNFTKNRTRVEIFNNAGIRIAYALPARNDVDVLSDVSLNAVLNIVNTDEVRTGGLVGRWDVTVTTEFAEGGDEVVVGQDLFEISAATASLQPAISSSGIAGRIAAQQTTCEFTFDILDSLGGRPNGAPFLINTGYAREITIERARSGVWQYDVQIGECSTTPSFKIITTAANFGYVTGEVRDGLTGDGIDNATIEALTGEQSDTPVSTTLSSGGGYYLLPLSASEQNYTIIARKNGMTDFRRDVVISDGKATTLNFSLSPTISCPLNELAEPALRMPFYRFRDEVLAKTPEGRCLTALYYRHAADVMKLLTTSPTLAGRFKKLAADVAPDIPVVIAGGALRPATEQACLRFYRELTDNASPGLRRSLMTAYPAVQRFIAALRHERSGAGARRAIRPSAR